MRALHLALASAVLTFACGGTPAAPPAPPSNRGGTAVTHEPIASIERTACFGWCPIYKLTVYRDGAVEYDGDSYVKIKGKATGRIANLQVVKLEILFQKYGYFALHDEYTDYSVTDMPSVNTSFSIDGKTKSIKHYLGDSHAPKELGEIEDGFDRIVEIERWIGTEKERENLSRGGP